jgi:hypothetical protein
LLFVPETLGKADAIRHVTPTGELDLAGLLSHDYAAITGYLGGVFAYRYRPDAVPAYCDQ